MTDAVGMTNETAVFLLLVAAVLGNAATRARTTTTMTRRSRRRSVVVSLLLLVEVSRVAPSVASSEYYPTLSPTAGLMLRRTGEASASCYKDTLLFHQALENRTLWAARMLDASARSVTGGLWGARFQLGSFDACLSAGDASPVGSRYCLASLSAYSDWTAALPCDRVSVPMWDQVTGLDAGLDVRVALQGCGMALGSVPLGDVLVALCVPDSCDAESLQMALRGTLLQEALFSGLRRSAFDVRVEEAHCVGHAELRHASSYVGLALLFWSLVLGLSGVVLLSPYLGTLSAWDWRTHLHALVLPEAPLRGMDLNALSGIRAVNMVLLVGVHRAFNAPRLPSANLLNTVESRTSPWHALGHHGALLVDTCFFMSGLLMALSAAGRQQKQQNSLRAIATRYLRLTPPYLFVLMFYALAMESAGSGPLWKATTRVEAEACRRWWWTNVLYVNNYVHGELGEHSCMLQSWSLAVDMQQFVVASLLLPLALRCLRGEQQQQQQKRDLRWAAALTAAVTVAVALPFVLTLQLGWPAMLVWSERALRNPYAEPLFHAAYAATHMRTAPYVVGVAAGCAMLYVKSRGLTLSCAEAAWLTWGALSTMLGVLVSSVAFGDLQWPAGPSLEAALYASLTPALWAAALAALLAATTFGPPTTVACLLRLQPLVTLSRLSYGVYLVHFAVQLLQGGAERSPAHFTVNTVIRSGFSDVIFSLAISLWLYLALEAPVRYIAKHGLAGKKSSVAS